MGSSPIRVAKTVYGFPKHRILLAYVAFRYIQAHASIAQLVERILGKDEVAGPTPARSSIFSSSSRVGIFLLRGA